MWSSMRRSSARRTGWWSGVASTAVPNRIRVVPCSSAAPSSSGETSAPPRAWWNSVMKTASNPASSAIATSSRSSSQSTSSPASFDWMGRITPKRIARAPLVGVRPSAARDRLDRGERPGAVAPGGRRSTTMIGRSIPAAWRSRARRDGRLGAERRRAGRRTRRRRARAARFRSPARQAASTSARFGIERAKCRGGSRRSRTAARSGASARARRRRSGPA